MFLGDFDSSGAPVDGLWYGHLDMTCRTELFPPQPLLYTLQRDRKRVSHHFYVNLEFTEPKWKPQNFIFLLKMLQVKFWMYFVWYCYFNLNEILLPPLTALCYVAVKNSLSSFVFLLVSLFVFSVCVCVLPLCGRCVCTAGLWCRRLLDSSHYDRSDTQCRHHSATQRLELTVVLWLR